MYVCATNFSKMNLASVSLVNKISVQVFHNPANDLGVNKNIIWDFQTLLLQEYQLLVTIFKTEQAIRIQAF